MSEEYGDPDDFGELLSTADVAKLLGLNLNTVQRYVKEGLIPSHRLHSGRGAKRYIFKSELLEHLRNQPADPGVAESDDESGDSASDSPSDSEGKRS